MTAHHIWTKTKRLLTRLRTPVRVSYRFLRKNTRRALDALGSRTGRITTTTLMSLSLLVLFRLAVTDRLPDDPLAAPFSYLLVASITLLLIGLRELALNETKHITLSTRRSAS